jgi:hypothetical protein
MVREGFPVAGLTPRENAWVWTSLTQHRRWEQLQRLTGMDDAQLRARIRVLRQQVKGVAGKR